MPWKSFEQDGEYCVFKLDDAGEKTGDTLGCHPDKAAADKQVAALYANNEGEDMPMMEDERARGLFEAFWSGLKGLFARKAEPATARAISTADLYQRLWDKLMETGGEDAYDNWPVDIYHDDGRMYLITANRGKLYRYDVALEGDEPALGQPVEVTIQHAPVTTRTVIRQQADGRYRWVSRSATSTLNRVGEIDSRALFASFVEHIDKTGEYPIRQFYHQGEQFRTGQADFVAVDGNVLITSGLYDDTLLAQREREAIGQEPAYWGESIGYKPTAEPELAEVADGIRIPVYRAGILREISTLPEEQAANLFTAIHQVEVNRMLKGKVREAFIKLFGDNEEEADKWLAENVDELNRSIEEGGLVTRTQEPPAEPPIVSPVVELDDTAIAAIVAKILEGNTVDPIVARALQHEVVGTLQANVTELATTVADLVTRLAALEAGEAARAKTRQDDMPRNGKVVATYRPREAHATDAAAEPLSKRAAANRPKNAY